MPFVVHVPPDLLRLVLSPDCDLREETELGFSLSWLWGRDLNLGERWVISLDLESLFGRVDLIFILRLHSWGELRDLNVFGHAGLGQRCHLVQILGGRIKLKFEGR